MERQPLIVITGPTASGKTRLSIDVAKRLGGEIVSADSMQIYQTMDIATAKPTPEERDGIPHHLLDFLAPGESFSVAAYAKLARQAIEEISLRDKLPILCGGTGLYLQAVVDNLQFAEEPKDTEIRGRLQKRAETEGGQSLLDELFRIDPDTAERLTAGNLGRIIRALEIYETTGIRMSEQLLNSRREPSPYAPCILALDYSDRAVLYDRINRRVDQMMEAGLLREAEQVLSEEGMSTACQAIGHKELAPYFRGEKPLEDCVEQLKRETRRYAKRQLTWIRRDPRTRWVYPDQYESYALFFQEVLRIILDFLKNHRDFRKDRIE